MLRYFLDEYDGQLPNDTVVIFNNTGREHKKTLKFVNDIETNWNVPIVWTEWRLSNAPLVPSRDKVGPWDGFVVVNYQTAARAGEPFRSLIDWKGFLPNPAIRYCTQHLKAVVTDLYLRTTLGWKEWTLYGGIRYDEPKRWDWAGQTTEREIRETPLVTAKVTKPMILDWWKLQPFDLEIPEHLGNCIGCYQKGLVKLRRIAVENPGALDWEIEQEHRMKTVAKTPQGARFRLDRPSYKNLALQPYLPGVFDEQDDDSIPCDCAM